MLWPSSEFQAYYEKNITKLQLISDFALWEKKN